MIILTLKTSMAATLVSKLGCHVTINFKRVWFELLLHNYI